ncbi:MAG: radical SAM protein [Candidatus Magnetoovum sp. WYHC-5]|nr:radical SAM protein [Candidatus Magnetoovum sp. WYHC-5]
MGLKVCEIFTSIQGESSYAGLLCFFIRLTGCNLRCTYCDTDYAYYDGNILLIDELVEMVRVSNVDLVEITGGEPLLQEETPTLIERLINEGKTVLIETNGSLSIEHINEYAVIIMDIKTPSSGMTYKMNFNNIAHLKPKDEIKFVISDEMDYLWVKNIISSYELYGKYKLLLSPAYGVLHPEKLANWIIRDKLNVRMNLQLHKYIYGDNIKGV